MDLNDAPSRNDAVVSRRAAETVILLDPGSGEYFTLDDVGGRVWELCDGSRSVEEIIGILVSEYDAPAADIRADVLELLGELHENRLVA